MANQTTIKQFQARFPNEEACMDHLMRVRFGERLVCLNCQRDARYYRVAARRCFECEHCGYQLYPTAGTPFEKTRTPLTDWFYVMFLFCASRNGVAAKEVQRQIGVTYKTAWRMCREIRIYMGYVDGDHKIGGSGGSGVVEIDKTFIGGRDKSEKDDKAIVLGMIERSGDIITRQIPDRRSTSIKRHVWKFVQHGTRVYTDEARSLKETMSGVYRHDTVDHSKDEWVRGDVHTNSIESFWGTLKRGIAGTYIAVSKRHLQKYLWEFEFRHNLRKTPHLMFEILLQVFPRAAVAELPASSAT